MKYLLIYPAIGAVWLQTNCLWAVTLYSVANVAWLLADQWCSMIYNRIKAVYFYKNQLTQNPYSIIYPFSSSPEFIAVNKSFAFLTSKKLYDLFVHWFINIQLESPLLELVKSNHSTMFCPHLLVILIYFSNQSKLISFLSFV